MQEVQDNDLKLCVMVRCMENTGYSLTVSWTTVVPSWNSLSNI